MLSALVAFLVCVAVFGALYVAAGAFFFGLSCAFDWVTGLIRDVWAARGRRVTR
jgi:hypothetical protein